VRAHALALLAVSDRQSEGEDLGPGVKSPLRRLKGGRRTKDRQRRTEDEIRMTAQARGYKR